jgi:hypothetical protein
MTDTFRALCEELVDVCDFPSPFHYKADVINRARAALAEQPVGPTDEGLWELFDEKLGPLGFTEDWPWIRNYARAVLARWGQPAIAPPADGEVARFAGWLRAHRDQCVELGRPDWAHMVNRAAELLEQRHPTPIPVDERLPFAECDEDQTCWWYGPKDDHWCLASQFVARLVLEPTHWLPFNALPVPTND